MKKTSIILLAFLLSSFIFVSCSDDNEESTDPVGTTIDPISQLIASATTEENEVSLTWTNPDDPSILKVEISYRNKNLSTRATPNPILVDVAPGSSSTLKVKVPNFATYIVTAVSISKSGKRSTESTAEVTPYTPDPETVSIPVFLTRADTLMTSMTELFLDGKPRDIWSSTYPQSEGWWDGAAVIWGHGGAFSGYVALKEAAEGFPEYKSKYETAYDNRLLTAIDMFRNTRDGKAEAYAVYPGDGDERYYDDNIWVGIDMTDLYLLTKDTKYLERAEIVWNFILQGTDDLMGGGVYWKEDGKSKHTCSTAPASVLASKLYLATNNSVYLQSAKDLYAWCKNVLQDPSDYLYWDSARLSDENDPNSAINVDKAKYSYNSGQPMQAAALLYNITKEGQYLQDAQNIAKAAYKKWFIPFHSYALGESFQILDPGHVWFQAIMFRGYIELYKIDRDRTYVTAYEKTLSNAWLSTCRNEVTNLLNGDFRGGTTQTSWEVIHEGACVEMLSRLASLERDGL